MKTIINGKEIKLFGRQEIGMVFTQKVNEYLAKGFIFNLAESSRGCQGEEMKACLTNDGGKTVYIIFIESCYGGFRGVDTMVIQVRKYEDAKGNSTLWLNRGEEIEKKVFYGVEARRYCRRDEERYVENLEESEMIKSIQDERFSLRCSMKNNEKELPEKYKKLVLKIIQKKKGLKSRQLKDIVKVTRREKVNILVLIEYF